MAKKTTNDTLEPDGNPDDNFKHYKKRLAEIGKKNLIPSPDFKKEEEPDNHLMRHLANEGEKLLNVVPPTPPTPASPIVDNTNPYVRARGIVLEKMGPVQKEIILKMEQNGNINNFKYDRFVKEVGELGYTLFNDYVPPKP